MGDHVDLALECRDVTKRFGKTLANDHVSLTVRKGEILSVLGENGSGKTTLMNMISGIYFPDAGQIFVDGAPVTIASPKDAFDLGIGMIHQHFKLVDVLTAAENIILGLPGKGRLNMPQIVKDIQALTGKYGFELDPNQKIYDMSVSQKQTVEIVKVLYRGARILILDEPTAVLTPQETDKLFAVLRNMRADGHSIIIITHKLQEVLAISDRVSVLRKGAYIGTVDTASATEGSLTEMMVGKKIDLNIDRPAPLEPRRRLSVRGVHLKNAEGRHLLRDVSFDLYGGEILGVAGIAGSGQKELLETIAGLSRAEDGSEILYYAPQTQPEAAAGAAKAQTPSPSEGAAADDADGTDGATAIPADAAASGDHTVPDGPGKAAGPTDAATPYGAASDGATAIPLTADGAAATDLRSLRPSDIRRLGVRLSFVPEDRLGMGLVGSMDLTDNMMLRGYHSGRGAFLDRRTPRDLALRIIDRLDVSTPGVTTPVRRLSGGNVQKVLVGREISSDPTVLMVAYPVRGLDINSSYTIYRLLNEQKQNGVAVLCVGEDLDVLLMLCDRILVLCGGEVSGVVDARSSTKEEIGLMMTGKVTQTA
ncbi:MAG: ABC transporter ATP-binding protein [Lachnospiraceae bacterium]|jgi:simple sugar transport system ATP-binding protein|nr:ABC transporter ATP-binding protein [Lachnospiraceae bacterium]